MRYDLRNGVINKIVKILQVTVIPELTSLVGSSPISLSPFSAPISSSNVSSSYPSIPPSSFSQHNGSARKGRRKQRAENQKRHFQRESTFSVFGGERVEEEEEAKRAVVRTLVELVCCIELGNNNNNNGGVYGIGMVSPPAMDKFGNGKWAKDVIESWFIGNGSVRPPTLVSVEEEGEGEGKEGWGLNWRNALKEMLKLLVCFLSLASTMVGTDILFF